MTAPADRVHRAETGGKAPVCRSRVKAQRWARARVDAEFAAIVARATDPQTVAGPVPSAERCADAGDPAVELRQQVGRIASALFCSAGMDPQLLAFAIRRVADHHAVDDTQVIERIADEVLRIAAALTTGR